MFRRNVYNKHRDTSLLANVTLTLYSAFIYCTVERFHEEVGFTIYSICILIFKTVISTKLRDCHNLILQNDTRTRAHTHIHAHAHAHTQTNKMTLISIYCMQV